MDFLFRKKRHNHQSKSKQKLKPEHVQDYRAVAATDIGSVRTNNEDQLVFIRPFDLNVRRDKGCLAIVADGMGGHSSGEIASQMAIDIISRQYYDAKTEKIDSLKKAFEKANKAIFKLANERTELKGMGTTCTAIIMKEGELVLGHVGDSRAYLLKGKELIQLSNDHTYMHYLLSQGMISQEEALSHPDRNIITQAMGTSPKLKADYAYLDTRFEPGDRLLLCSDGLYEYVQQDELQALMTTHALNDLSKSLIKLAKQRGGHDNISVLVVETGFAGSSANSRQTEKLHLS